MMYIVVTANNHWTVYNPQKLRQVCDDLVDLGMPFSVIKGETVNYKEE